MPDESMPNIYLLNSCPFCLKLRIFLSEAGLADRFNFVTFEQGNDTHREVRARLEAAGHRPSFPAVEFSSGEFTTGTDDIIARIAGDAGVEPTTMPLLKYYSEGVFTAYLQTYSELRELKDAQASQLVKER